MYEPILRAIFALSLIFACCLTSGVVVAQQPPEVQTTAEKPQEPSASGASEQAVTDAYFMSDAHRQEIYEANRKRGGRAVLLTLAFPGLGNIYAEQFVIAGLAFVAMTFATVFVSYGLVTKQHGIAVTGLIVAGGAYGGGIATSIAGVNRFNRLLREGLKIEQARAAPAFGPTLSFRF